LPWAARSCSAPPSAPCASYSAAISSAIFAGLITIAIVMGFYLLLMDPIRRNDARLEKWIERGAVALHRNVGALLSNAGTLMARTGSTLRQAGHNLHKRTVCL
jgi:lipid A 4'-phosphatase